MYRILHRNQTMVVLNDQIIEARSLATCYLVVHNCYLRGNKQGRGVAQKHYLHKNQKVCLLRKEQIEISQTFQE